MKSSISASRRRWSPFILKNECEIQRDLSGGNPSSAFKMFIHMQKSRTAGLMFNKWSVAHTRVKFLSVLTDPKWYPARQSLRLDPSASAFHNKFCINSAQLIDEVIRCCLVLSWLMVVGLLCFAEAKCLKDEEVLQTLPVGTTASFYFSDLGPQLTWGTVSPHVHRRTTFRTIQYCLHAFLVIVVNSVVSVCVSLLLITRMLQHATSGSVNSKCQKWFDSHGPFHMVTSLSVHACPLVMTQLMNAVFFTDWLFWKKKACFAQWSAKLTRYVLNRLKHAKPERHGL